MNTKQKIYLVLGISLIIAVFLIEILVRPLILEIKESSDLVRDRNEKLIILQKTSQSYLEQLESDYNDIQQDIALVKAGFLDTDKAVDFFIELEKIANATFNELKIEASKFPSFSLHLLGDFPALMKFLGWLESSSYFVDVDSMTVRLFSETGLFPKEGEEIPTGRIKSVLDISIRVSNLNIYD